MRNALFTETVTLYNAKLNQEADSDVYHRTVIKGASWFSTMKSSVDSNGLNAANQITVKIPSDADTEGKTYLPPTEYAAAVDVSRHFTLTEGAMLVRGKAVEENPRPADLRKNHSDVLVALSVTNNTLVRHLKHWKVVGA